MFKALCFGLFFIHVVNGFLCGDNGNCECNSLHRTIYCRNVNSPLDIQFSTDITERYTTVFVPESFSCQEIAELERDVKLTVINSKVCGKTSEKQDAVLANGGTDEQYDKRDVQYKGESSEIYEKDHHSVDKSSSNFEVSFKVINILLFIIMSLVGLKFHYNMRPFVRLLPKPYSSFTGFMSFLLRRNTDVPDVSQDLTKTLNTDDIPSAIEVQVVGNGNHNVKNCSELEEYKEKKRVEGAVGGIPEVSDKSPIEYCTPLPPFSSTQMVRKVSLKKNRAPSVPNQVDSDEYPRPPPPTHARFPLELVKVIQQETPISKISEERLNIEQDLHGFDDGTAGPYNSPPPRS